MYHVNNANTVMAKAKAMHIKANAKARDPELMPHNIKTMWKSKADYKKQHIVMFLQKHQQ